MRYFAFRIKSRYSNSTKQIVEIDQVSWSRQDSALGPIVARCIVLEPCSAQALQCGSDVISSSLLIVERTNIRIMALLTRKKN